MKHRCELTFNGTFSASLKTDYGTVVISSPAEILSVLNGYEDVSRALTKIQEENERIDEEERQMWV
jgi:hypothetical protein